MERKNMGYVIERAVRIGRTEVVFGVNPTERTPYVTWRTNEWENFQKYYWGHYFENEKEALENFNKRIKELQQDLKQEKKPSELRHKGRER